MTPREELRRNMTEALDEDYTGTTAEIAIGELEGFAIGKWVSVDERLPSTCWQGYTKGTQQKAYMNERLVSLGWKFNGYDETDSEPTDWLDLSLPEVGGGE